MNGIQVDMIVPNKYTTYGSGTSSTYSIPMFDFGYTISYSFSEVAYGAESASGQKFPEYGIASNLVLISRYNFSWSGLTSTEKQIFDNFIKRFNNSFQPFVLRIWVDGVSYADLDVLIEQDTLTITEDKFGLFSVTFTCLEIEGGF